MRASVRCGVEAFGRRVEVVHLALDGVDQLIGQLSDQGAEDGGLAGKVKVGRALGASGAVDDVVDGRAVVALFAEDIEGSLQEGKASRVFAAGRRTAGQA